VALRRDLARGAEGAGGADATDDGTVRILLAHRPDAVLDLDHRSRIDLTVAGHTHGGQVVLPGFGPLMTMSDVPRAAGRGGLHRIDGNAIYVSTGVGLERAQSPQVRLFSRPSIGVLELV
jgi:predicted MPP superfamily phosphohydrolase